MISVNFSFASVLETEVRDWRVVSESSEKQLRDQKKTAKSQFDEKDREVASMQNKVFHHINITKNMLEIFKHLFVYLLICAKLPGCHSVKSSIEMCDLQVI